METTSNSLLVTGGFDVNRQALEDVETTFRARAALGAERLRIRGGFRYRDRDSRYVLALRGGHDNDVYLERYTPGGGEKFLGLASLDFKQTQPPVMPEFAWHPQIVN